MKFIKRDKTKGSLTNDIRGASGIVSNNSSGNSSTTLESHRIWGQLFDGTNDVTGDMQNVGSITATGNIQTDESVIIKQLDADGNEVEGGDLTISVEDKKAKFSGKDQYVFDGAIEGTDIKANGNLDVTGASTMNDVTVNGASTMNSVTVNGDAAFNKNIEVKGQSKLNDVSSNNITNSDTIKTKNLEVTGSAHFFELIIDKIKAAGGAVLFTPANGFKVDIVESVTNGYKLYWQADDGSGNQADNMWKVNDQALCMSFNQAKEGTNHNISNKYYWSLVTAVSDTNQPVSIEEKKYHYIVISTVTKDGTVNPEIGDTIAMLGYRGTDDKKRQSAIYISAYTSLDKGLTAPLLAQYQGINDFNLESHRKSYFDAVGAKFVGNFEVSNGQTIEDYINNKIDGAESGTPYIGENGNWFIWDSDTKAYKDSGIKAEGKDGANGKDGTDGKDAVTYILESTPSTIILNSDGSFNRNNQHDEQKYLYVWGYKIVNGKRTNKFTVNGNPITCRLSFNDGDVYTEYTADYEVGIDFDPQYEDSYYSLLEEIGQNGLKNARAIMFEGTEYAADKVLASIDIPIIQNGENGTNGKDAILYKMYPSNEYAVVDSDGYLYTNAQYLIYRQIGSSKTAITPLSTGYHVQYNITGSWTNATINDSYCVVNSKVKYSSTSNANYIPIRLVSGSGTLETVVDQKVIPVTYKASATLTINQELGEIKTNVQDTQNLVDSLNGDIQTVRNNMSTLTQKANSIESKVTTNTTNINTITGKLSSQSTSISKLEQKANSIESNVTSNTTTINNLSGSVTSLQSDMSNVKQTAESITSTVSSVKDDILGANCMLGLNGQGWSSNTIYEDAGNSFHCESTDWFQSHPIMDFSGDYTFSFGLWNDNLQIKILDFTQTYYDDGIYNPYVDFGTKTPCKILTTYATVPNAALANYATSGTSSNWTYTNTETITLKVGDNVAVRVTNGDNKRYNSIYGTVSAINTSSKSVTVNAIALLDQPNTICTLTCPKDKKDGTDINSLHYDEKLGRYWIRFKETRGTAKTFVMLFRNLSTSTIGWISRLMLEESVEYPHKYNATGQASQSMIKQTANEILMSVNDTYLKIGDGNITLNGDTKVNGALTLTQTDQGFKLVGSDGITEIKPESIGTYDNFKEANTSTQNVIKTVNQTGYETSNDGILRFEGYLIIHLGDRKKGDFIKYKVGTLNAEVTNGWNGSSFSKKYPISCSFSAKIMNQYGSASIHYWNTIYAGKEYSYTFNSNTTDARIYIFFKGDTSYSTWLNGYNVSTGKPMPRPNATIKVNGTLELPMSAHMLIGYDGWGINFGNNKLVYCGKDGFIAKYGNNEFRITDAGISHNNMATTYTIIGSSSSSSPTTYTVQDPIDTVLCKSGYCKVIFPSNPYNGQRIKIYDKSPAESYINSNGKYVCGADRRYSDRSIWTNQNLPNMAVRIYTYINDTWFEEYTG